MPHKHTRRKGGDEADFDLAPSRVAKPLPAYGKTLKQQKTQQDSLKGRCAVGNSYKHDDTPRAFARIMEFQTLGKRGRSALDDGSHEQNAKKKRRRTDLENDSTQDSSAPQTSAKSEIPTILPGERLGDFAARVDHALPVGHLTRKGKVKIEGVKERQTKPERRQQRMHAAWRAEDARLREREEERREQEEELQEERSAAVGGQSLEFPATSKKGRRRIDGEDDPWAELKAKREEPRGLNDVAQAPPSFKAVPKEKFKVRNGARVDVANIPTAAGSLKRREELSDARKEIIERYRAVMRQGS